MELVFATAEEVGGGGRDNEGNAHSAAGGGGDNNGITTGIWNEDIIVFIMDCAGSASDVDVIFKPYWQQLGLTEFASRPSIV